MPFDVSGLEKEIGTKFKDKNLLLQALTHRSYLNENPDWALDHNERLEFLGEAKDTGRARQYILANAVEALIGAVYLDQGYEVSKKFIHAFILDELNRIIEKRLYRDAKSLFQEKAQEKVGITPSYEVLEEWGPDHARQFKVGV